MNAAPGRAMVTAVTPSPTNPFKGPFPLGLGDPIFGRDREIRELLSMLVARRLVLLHAVSGCGKTSLLEAGVRPQLEQRRLRGLPTIRLTTAGIMPVAGRNRLTTAVLGSLDAGSINTSDDAPAPPAMLDAELTRIGGHHVGQEAFGCFFFDQLEEALTTGDVSEEERREFFKELGRSFERRDRWAVFAIRDDYLGALEPYLRYLPTQLSARLRLTQLTEDQANQAIVRLCANSAVRFTQEAATRMARELATSGGEVEPVYLQVAGRYVWNASHDAGIREIGPGDITLPGRVRANDDPHESLSSNPVERALRNYYDESILAVARDSEESQQRLRHWFTFELIALTAQGERRRQTLWTEESPISEPELDALENRYLVRRDHRQGVWVELAHDRLVRPVLTANTLWQRRFRQPWQEAAEHWHTSNRDAALLLVNEPQLAEAEAWASPRKAWLAQHDREFLDHSRIVVDTRRKTLRRFRLTSAAAGVAALIAIAASAWAIMAGREAVTLERAAARAEASAAVAEADAHTARLLAARQTDDAKDAERAADRFRQLASEAAKGELAATRVRDAAIRETVIQKENAQRATDEAGRQHEEARQQQIKNEIAATRLLTADKETRAAETTSVAYNLIADSGRTGDYEASVNALTALADGQWTVTASGNQRRATLDTLTSLQNLFSRSLLLDCLPTHGFVQSLAVSQSAGAIRYLTQGGESYLSSGTEPCSQARGVAPATGDQRVNNGSDFWFPTASTIARDGSIIAVGTANGRVQVVDEHKESSPPFLDHRHEITALQLSPSGRYLLSASALWSFSVRDLADWPKDQSGPRRVYRVPPVGLPGWFRWLKISFGETTHVVKSFAVFESANSPGDGLIATGRQDAAVVVYRLRKPEEVMNISGPLDSRPRAPLGHFKPVLALAFDSTGERLASGGQDGLIFVWPLPKAGVAPPPAAEEEIPLASCTGNVESLAFSPDDTLLAAGCQEGTILLLDPRARSTPPAQREQPETLRGQIGEVRNLAFDPVRRRLYASGAERRIEEWYVPTRDELIQRQRLIRRMQDLIKTLRNAGEDAPPPSNAMKELLQSLQQQQVPGKQDYWPGMASTP